MLAFFTSRRLRGRGKHPEGQWVADRQVGRKCPNSGTRCPNLGLARAAIGDQTWESEARKTSVGLERGLETGVLND
jgi:hypothetical protein